MPILKIPINFQFLKIDFNVFTFNINIIFSFSESDKELIINKKKLTQKIRALVKLINLNIINELSD